MNDKGGYTISIILALHFLKIVYYSLSIFFLKNRISLLTKNNLVYYTTVYTPVVMNAQENPIHDFSTY